MAFRYLYSLDGGNKVPTLAFGFGAVTIGKGDVVQVNSSGQIAEPGSDAADVFGYLLDPITSGATGGPQTDRALVVPFVSGAVYATTEVAGGGSPVEADIGEARDLDVSGGAWGIHASSAATANTPNFVIVDIDTLRGEWHVVISPSAALFQALGAGQV